MRIQTRRAATPRESSLVTLRRLIRENARLNRLCEKNSGIAERYALLRREGDHRIKNSLQIVASLLDIQARRAPDSSTHTALHTAAARILAVARIHDALQLNNGNDDVVDLGALLTRICVSLDELAGDSLSVQIMAPATAIEAPLTLAQPIALAMNELVLNALRDKSRRQRRRPPQQLRRRKRLWHAPRGGYGGQIVWTPRRSKLGWRLLHIDRTASNRGGASADT
jgi:two-component sensor histidine kinase